TYHTTWGEPGISCEACHGSAGKHVEAMKARAAERKRASASSAGSPTDKAAGKSPDKVAGKSHDDVGPLHILRSKDMTAAQTNDMCATCHAKLVPLSLDFLPGDRFFDHFDLIVLD
uniref:hypothetical protein n=1 Tax=Salmonella enterica TaxID=28901 RepID=UPI0035253708